MAGHSSIMLYLPSHSESLRLRYSTLPPGTNAPHPVRCMGLQDKRKLKVRCMQEQLPTESLFNRLKCCLTLLGPLDQIWSTLLGEVSRWTGQFREGKVTVFFTCGCTCSLPKFYTKYHTSLRPTAHFFGLAVSLAHLSDSSTAPLAEYAAARCNDIIMAYTACRRNTQSMRRGIMAGAPNNPTILN